MQGVGRVCGGKKDRDLCPGQNTKPKLGGRGLPVLPLTPCTAKRRSGHLYSRVPGEGLARRLQFDFDLWMTIGARLRCLLHLLLGTVRVYPVGPIGRVRRCDSLFLLHVLSWSNMVVDTYECGTVFNLLERRVQNKVTLLKNGLFEL